MLSRIFSAVLLIAVTAIIATYLLLPSKENIQNNVWLNAREITLPNGLQMVHVPNHRAPWVHISVWYKAGGAQDPAGKNGLAHYMEHLMFRPPVGQPDYNFSNIVNGWGGDNNAFTSYDITAYFAKIPTLKANEYMRMEAVRMTKLEPYKDQAATELQVIAQERAQTIDSEPRRFFGEKRNAFIYGEHAYGRSLIGAPDSIAGLTYDDAQQFHTAFYAPNNAVLVIAGDITWAKAVSLTKNHFGRLKAHSTPEDNLATPKDNDQKKFVYCDARIQQPEIHIIYPMPPDHENKVESASASVLMSALEADPSTDLYKMIVENEKLVSSYSAQYDANLKHSAALTLSFWPSETQKNYNQTLRDIEKSLGQAISKIDQKKVDELARQNALLYQLAADTPISLAMSVGYEVAKGRALIDIKNEPALISSITLDDIKTLNEAYIKDVEPYSTMLLPMGDTLCAR